MSTGYQGGGGGGGGGGSTVKVDGADTTSGFLGAKLVAGDNVLLTVQNPGGNESIRIDANENCVPNNVDAIGLYSCAENNTTIASGFGSHAEGDQNRAGLLPLVFSIAPGGTLVTITGNFVGQFTNGIPCRITPTAPVAKKTVNGLINSVAVFGGVNTTFQLAAPIDGTSTGGLIVESGQTISTGGVQRGIGAHAEGVNCIAQGAESHAEGAVCIAYGPAAHAEGGITTAVGIQAHAEGESTIAYGVDSHAEGGSTIAGGFCAHAEGGAGATPGPRANGNSSHAEGQSSQTGNPLRTFTLPAGGTLITIAGNVCSEFSANSQVLIYPLTPGPGASVGATIDNVGPVFAAGNTTFNLTVPIANGVGLQTPVDGPEFANQITGGLCLQGNIAGVGAHAEGAAVALGLVSHAEGNGSRALNSATHAEGQNCVAFGQNSHAEGQACISIGTNAHAEGASTLANANTSHVEGTSSRAGFPLRAFTIAAGGILVTIAGNVTAEFLNTSQVYISSTTPTALPPVILNCASVPAFAAGNTTFNLSAPIDPYVTGGLINTPGFGANAHAEGNTTIATGLSAHAEGLNTTASGAQSHSEGSSTTASGSVSHSEGVNTLASNTGSHAEGNGSTASGAAAHSEGSGTSTASGAASHSEGNNTLASGDQSHAEGNGCQATNGGAHAEGVNSVANKVAAHAEGNQCTASGNNAHAEGNLSTASGSSAHAEGNGTTAQGNAAHSEGDSCIASGNRSHAEGISCQARNDNAHSEGNGCFADGVNSHSQGLQAHAYGLNEHAESGGQFATLGDNQYRRVQIRGSTPGAVPGETTTLLTGGAANNFLQNSTAYLVKIRAIATRMGLGASARQTASFDIEFIASVTSAGAVTVSAVTSLGNITQGAGFVAATLTPTSGGANDLTITFAIAGGLTVASRITANVEYVEVLGT